MTQPTTIDKLAMGLSGALMLLGIVVLGFVEVLAGPPYGAAPILNDAGEVVATPLIDPNLRTGLVILALIVLLLWGIYKVAMVEPTGEETTVADPATH